MCVQGRGSEVVVSGGYNAMVSVCAWGGEGMAVFGVDTSCFGGGGGVQWSVCVCWGRRCQCSGLGGEGYLDLLFGGCFCFGVEWWRNVVRTLAAFDYALESIHESICMHSSRSIFMS